MSLINFNTLSKKQNTLSYRLLIYVLICSSIFTFLATLSQLYFDYRENISEMDKNFEFIEQTLLPAINSNVYLFDMEQLKLQIDGMIKLNNISYITIFDTQGLIYKAGDEKSPRNIIKTYTLNYDGGLEKKFYLGTMTIIASLEDIYIGIIKKFFIILISNGVKMFIASFVILLIIQHLVTQHIKFMAAYTQTTDPTKKNTPLKLKRPGRNNEDELDQLVNAINDQQQQIYSDIKKRNRVEEALKSSEDQFRTLAESSNDIIMRFDRNFRHLYVNPAVTKVLPFETWEFIGKTHQDLGLPKELTALWENAISRTFESKNTHRIEFKLPNGIWIDWLLFPELSSSGEVNAVITSARDITKRKQYEVQLYQLRAFSENIINSMPSILIGIDREKNVTHWNLEAEAVTGLNNNSVINKKLEGIMPSLDPYLNQYWGEEQQHKPWKKEKAILYDQPIKYFDIVIYPLKQKEGDAAVIRLDDVTQRVLMELKIKNLNAELEVRVESRTEELQQSLSRLKQTQDHLVQSEKMAALGALVAGISHEINTPLGLGVTESTFLKDKAEECYEKYQNDEMTEPYFKKFIDQTISSTSSIYRNLERTGKLITSFKQVAVDQTSEDLRIFNVKEYIDGIILSLTPKLKQTSHKINVKCPEALKIKNYPGAFSQIITNFIINSLIHGLAEKEQGIITLDIEMEDNILSLVYKDDGIGMAEEAVKKIFDPFFTTNRGHGGTGLGMHVVYNLIVQKLQGTISCTSSPNNGVEFILKFPVEVTRS